ncbi:UNVERIFIED_CONTAM: hypothetical protein Scaly_1797700 [Sesamum calycinum]|uniref:GAG-pre-integrase domain-containing protein n=1 Tax=Sesamum calycinum TaxID=2727403 RepID=A0AAW2NY21_9LAMI
MRSITCTLTVSSFCNVDSERRSGSGALVRAALAPSLAPPSSGTCSAAAHLSALRRLSLQRLAATATPSSPGVFIASYGESWVIDSGATSHLTGNRSFFQLSPLPKFPPVRLADGSYSPISGSGTVQPTVYLTLTNVLFAPKFPDNLLSDLQTRRTIGSGHERGGLYFLDTTPPVDARALSASVSPLQWHSRLGHPSLPTLQKILPIDSARLECESCELDVTFFEFTPFYSPESSAVTPPPSVPLPVSTLSVPPHTEPPTRPIQVYSRRNRSTNTTLIVSPDLPPTVAPGKPSATPDNDLHIALRKGKRSCTAHPLANSLSFSKS